MKYIQILTFSVLALAAGVTQAQNSTSPADKTTSNSNPRITTTTTTIDCDAAWNSLERDLPTPPSDISSAWAAAHTTTAGQYRFFTALGEICGFGQTAVPAGQQAGYSAFNRAYYSWYSASRSPWAALVTHCPSTAAYGSVDEQTSELGAVLTAYSSFAAQGCGGSGGATGGAAASASATATAAATGVSASEYLSASATAGSATARNVAPRETMAGAAAAAIIGLGGVLIAL
ncbi:uncharacterized protein JN550_006102 [Neoarthrinium moseri]|uniref:uncharacterized protein n=1 Tax=Neoarthrinium moseri TaxID=1658444 RepID=UPI001FDB7820|nr:uncharacterized protein JN550_006102 [Neoarthrinium moseri]KAI1869115.1 hypothetical protein JN550_006102 [Neoarthrinium moseri]